MTQESDESATVSHEEFVSGLRTGRVILQVDGPFAYPLAASRSGGFVWLITSWMNILLTSPVVSIAIVVVTFVLHDVRILLAVPAAILGPVFAVRYDCAPDTASIISYSHIILALLTIPLINLIL